MIEMVEIENLRGIVSGRLEGLSPLSILLGVNNSGKSTILEALYLGGIASGPREYLGCLVK
jgi:AAA15 family ATPase/GTPase